MTHDELAALSLDHLREVGLDDIFKPPLLNQPPEAELLRGSVRFQREMRRAIVQFLAAPRAAVFQPLVRLKIPKTRHAYRQASLVDVVDLVRYTALVAKVGSIIEENRIPDDLNIVFSSRFRPQSPFFGDGNGYDRFREASHRLSTSGEYSVKVISDISNFYDRLNLHRLEAALLDIGCDIGDVTSIDHTLKLWAGQNSYGIPVGCDASRLLAEAMLISVDNRLLGNNIAFVRYVDDYRMFARSYAEAHSYLNVLINALEQEGLFINSEKTRVVDCISADEPGDNDGGAPAKDFDVINEAEKVAIQIRIGGRYNSKISTYYREPGKDAIAKLRKLNADDMLAEALSTKTAEDELRFFVRVFIYGTAHNCATLIAFVSRHIHMLGFVVSALIKEQDRLTEEVRQQLASEFEALYELLSETDYYRLCIARLLSNNGYRRDGVFGRWFGRLRQDANPVFIRELICFFTGTFSREEVRQLVRHANGGCHMGVCRAIVIAALGHQTVIGERQAWARAWTRSSTDPFVLAACRDFLHGPEAA